MKGQPFKKIATVLKVVAPLALKGLGGPAGGLVANIIRKRVGGESLDDGALADKVASMFQTPEGAVELRKIEADLEEAEMELGLNFEKLHTEDRASARQLAANTTLWPQIILGGLYTLAYIATLWAFIRGYANVQEEYTVMVTSLIGALGAVQVQILNFFFGSSSGSKEKTIALSNGNGR